MNGINDDAITAGRNACPFCRAPYLNGSIPKRYACNRPLDVKDADLTRVHRECLEIEAKITTQL